MILCPICHEALKRNEKTYACKNGHSYDIAKQGYTNLNMNHSATSGDHPVMVDARSLFLEQGYYAPLCDLMIDALRERDHEVIVDAGCGEGYYTKRIQNALDCTMIAFDMSKQALKKASRKDKRSQYFLNTIFKMPLRDASIDAVCSLFAPIAKDEFARILKPGGFLYKAGPGKRHLIEMKEALYEQAYFNEDDALQMERFVLAERKELTYPMYLSQEDAQNLLKMTPYYYKTSKTSVEAWMRDAKLTITADFMLEIYQKTG